jgi:hypothetical protein
MSRFLAACLVLWVLPLLSPASDIQARWARPDEADAVVEMEHRSLNVSAEGHVDDVHECHIRILNEQGRERFGTRRLFYNTNTQSLTLLEARVITADGVSHPVPEHCIENRPLASNAEGFDDGAQMMISWPRADVGSVLVLKTRTVTRKQPLKGYFADWLVLGTDGLLLKQGVVELVSALPLHVRVNDPDTSFEVVQKGRDNHHTLRVTLKKPLIQKPVIEQMDSPVARESLVSVHVSTYASMADIAQGMAELWEPRISAPLTPWMQAAVGEARKKTSDLDQINAITSLVQTRIRYMGDWRSVEGRFFPRSFKEITASSTGDCKDFSAVTVAMLRAMGYKALPALVHRGLPFLQPDTLQASTGELNHAMVYVPLSDGSALWVDPTNFVSMAGGVFPDIADRKAVVPGHIQPLQTIPPVQAHHAVVRKDVRIQARTAHIQKHEGTLFLGGEEAAQLSGAALRYPPDVINEILLAVLSGERDTANRAVRSSTSLDSRIVQDITLAFRFDKKTSLLHTNAGDGAMLDGSWTRPFLDASEEQVGHVFLGVPSTLDTSVLFEGRTLSGPEALNRTIRSPWLDVERTCTRTREGVRVRDVISRLRSFASPAEIASPEWRDLVTQLRQHFVSSALVFDKAPARAS